MTFTQPLPKTFDEMVAAMLICEQTKGQSVYQHGQSVWEHLQQLIGHVKGDFGPESLWRLPDWVQKFSPQLLNHLHSEEILELYTTCHDLGKPYCCVTDEAGKRHFPNHAEVSSYVWNSLGGNPIVGKLIANDMVIHTASSEEIEGKLRDEWNCEDSISLLLTAIAEVHANATIFGGTDTISFKSKLKTVDRRGRQICKFYGFEQGNNQPT